MIYCRTIPQYLMILIYALLSTPLFAFPDCKRMPFDDGQQDLTFANWRQAIITAIERQDIPFLLQNLDNQIITKRDCQKAPSKGIHEFKEIWQTPEKTHAFKPSLELWEILQEGLSHGAVRTASDSKSQTTFYAPYYHVVFDLTSSPSDCPYNNILIEKNVKVHQSPNRNAKVLGFLSYELVEDTHSTLPDGWLLIRTKDREGYVESKYVRSSSDYRLKFTKQNGKWKITEITYFPSSCGG